MGYKSDKPAEVDQSQVHRIRITLTSRNVPSLEKVRSAEAEWSGRRGGRDERREQVCRELIKGAKDKQLIVKGPVRMPTKVLRITCRKTPCGEGSKTWDRFQMRIHKRIIMLHSPSEILKQIVRLPSSSSPPPSSSSSTFPPSSSRRPSPSSPAWTSR